ncbi:MAG: carboxypeptidase regulatory-like domain-containing protein [Candidatus Acidiferrales bacterium]
MRRSILILAFLVSSPFLATTAAAQTTAITGQVIGPDATPWAELTVIILNRDTGQSFEVRTNKDGRYLKLALRPGLYEISFYDPKERSVIYSVVSALGGDRENDISADFSKNPRPPHRQAQRYAEEADSNYSYEKAHIDAGLGAMYDSSALREQLTAASASQKGPLQEKLKSDYQIAVREFQLAEQRDSSASVNTRATILSHLAEAYLYNGQYEAATNAYQKAIELRPEAACYQNLGEAQARSALAQTDRREMAEKLEDAEHSCERARALDLSIAARCWENIGILLSNNGYMKDSIGPWQKTTELEPTNGQALFMLGKALLSEIQTKREDNVVVYVLAAGTTEAFQKCIDADPNGPYAPQAKEVLDELASMKDSRHP